MTDLSDIINILPVMKSGDDLLSALEVLPEYDDTIRNADVPARLMALSDLYRIYLKCHWKSIASCIWHC